MTSYPPPYLPPEPEGDLPGWPRPVPWAVRATWVISFFALLVGIVAALGTMLWLALILIPTAIIVSGLVSIIYRLRTPRRSNLPPI